MCVIIDKPAGIVIAEPNLKAAATKNNDGFGLMYVDSKTKRVKTFKSLDRKPSEVIEKMDWLKNEHAYFHMRIKTHGGIDINNTHPFKILDKEVHGRDLFFMHNGMISGVPTSQIHSDTAMFNKVILQPLLSRDPELLHQKAFQTLIEDYIGTSKLLFLDDLGRTVKLGNWEVYKGCAVSNTHSFTVYNTVASTTSSYASHRGSDYYDDPSDAESLDGVRRYPAVVNNNTSTTPPSKTVEVGKPATSIPSTPIKEADKEVSQDRGGETKEVGKEATESKDEGATQTTASEVINLIKQEVKKEVDKSKEVVYTNTVNSVEVDKPVSTTPSEPKETVPLVESKESHKVERKEDKETDDFDDYFQVFYVMKKYDEITADDLEGMSDEDIYRFIYDFPEEASVLIIELVSLYNYSRGV